MYSQRITLDHPAFAGRLKDHSRRSTYERRPILLSGRSRSFNDVLPPAPAETRTQVTKNVSRAKTAVQTGSTAMSYYSHAAVSRKPKTASRRKFRVALPNMYVVMASVLFVCGIGVVITQLRTNNHAVAQVRKVAQTANAVAAAPDEERPDNLAAYSVPAAQPRYIRIAEIGVEARVRRLGVDAKSQLLAPANIHDAGWYEDSAKPGDAGGAILIDGHVHGPSQPGVFYDLKKLQPGSLIQLERGDGKKLSFKVVKLQSYESGEVDMAAALTPAVPGKVGLNVITCDGKLKPGTTEYQKRLIVFAVAQ